MDTKERHTKENESDARREREYETADQIARSMPAEERNKERHHRSNTNRLWLWLGVIILIFILIYWLFSIGIFEDLIGYFNG